MSRGVSVDREQVSIMELWDLLTVRRSGRWGGTSSKDWGGPARREKESPEVPWKSRKECFKEGVIAGQVLQAGQVGWGWGLPQRSLMTLMAALCGMWEAKNRSRFEKKKKREKRIWRQQVTTLRRWAELGNREMGGNGRELWGQERITMK